MSLAEARRARMAWALLALLLLYYTIAIIDRNAISMVVDPIRKQLDISDVQISLILGLAFSSTYSTFGFFTGWLVDRAPRRLVIFSGVTLWGVAEAACGLANSFGMLFGARLFVGLGEAALMPAAHSLISDSFARKDLAKAMSIYSMGSVIGGGLALVIGGAAVDYLTTIGGMTFPFIGQVRPWQSVFLLTGLPTILLALLIFLVPEPARRRQAVPDGPAAGPRIGFAGFMRRNWRLWVIFFGVFGVMNVVNGAMIYWQPAYMSRFFHWRPADYGMALGLISAVAGAAGMMFSGWLVDRMFAGGQKDAPLRYYFWALIVSTPLVITAFLAGKVWVYLGLIWVAKFAMINFLGFASAAVQLTTPREFRGRAAGIFTTIVVCLVGAVAGPVIPAAITQYILHDETQIGLALAITVAVCVPIALITIVWGGKHFRRAIDEAELDLDG